MNPLRKTKQRFNTKELFGFDIETYDDNKKFYCCSVYNEKFLKTYMTVESFKADILDGVFNNSIICATNLTFDFFGMFFNSEGFDLIMRGSSLIYAKTYIYNNRFNTVSNRHKNSVTFLDTLNYCKMSVKQLGELVNVPKLKTPSFIGKKPCNKKQKDYMLKYNVRDAKISYYAIKYFYEKFENIGATPKLTIASTSMSLFKNKYLKDTYFSHDDDVNKELFKAYYGGRCEAFSRGNIKNYNYYDINSLYPSVMKDNDYPDPNTLRITYKNTLEYIKNYEGVSEITVHCPENMEYPVLPYRIDGKLKFPTGTWRGHYANIEIRKAIQEGYTIKKVHKQWYYKENVRPFDDFVEDMYKFRMENPDLNLTAKLLMNSLYGKFGQKYDTKIDILSLDVSAKTLNDCESIEQMGGYFIVKRKMKKPSFCFPIWALYVTAYGRIKLYDYVKNTSAIYCDTDSIITKSRLKSSKQLGKMQLEAEIIEGTIVKPKFYMINQNVKIKGVGKKIVCSDFLKIMTDPRVKYKKFAKPRESIRRGFVPNEIIDVIKKLNLEDDKREWKNKFNPNEIEHSRPYKIGLCRPKKNNEKHAGKMESAVIC